MAVIENIFSGAHDTIFVRHGPQAPDGIMD